MTLTPQAEARIDDRIRRLAPRGRPSARRELHSHVADAAEALAGGRPTTSGHVDAAFAALGSDQEIRAVFFPRPARAMPSKATAALLVLATALAVAATLGPDGGTATCSVSDGGTCTASAAGGALDLLLWSAPPLIVLAALAFLRAWVGAALAVAYLVMALLRAISDATIDTASWSLLLVAAGGVATSTAGRLALLDLRNRRTADG